eukprot:GEMP01017909.1.p1 GENE.GEMP01017909.1~~GEMP01017909.1.p1  ORF type:complete len:606 (+),score=152.59 GEMP01017909.1:409-2226(+)
MWENNPATESDVEDENVSKGEASELDDELTSLISFTNLESVVKHIISKFRKIDMRFANTDTSVMHMQDTINRLPTHESVAAINDDLITRINTVQKDIQRQAEEQSRFEDALERTKVIFNNVDKKIEIAKKEKKIQDNMLRELHEQTQEKANVLELHIFESKFAGYVTRFEHQKMVNQIQSIGTHNEDTEILAEKIRHLEKKFDDYTRSVRIEEDFTGIRSWVSRELSLRANEEAVTQKVQEILSLLKTHEQSTERGMHLLDDKMRSVADRITAAYVEIGEDMKTKADRKKVIDMSERMRDFAIKVDTDAFMKDCLPKMKQCTDSIKNFDKALQAHDAAFQHLDEIIFDKASKYDIVVANARIDACFPKESGMVEYEKLTKRVSELTKRLNHYVAGETERFQQLRVPDYTASFDSMNRKIGQKAEKCDLLEMYSIKANRIDQEEMARSQERLNHQLEYLAVSTFGLAKLALSEFRGESENTHKQQKSQVLMQTEALWYWVSNNEPPPNLNTMKINKFEDPLTQKKRQVEEKQRGRLEQKLGLVKANDEDKGDVRGKDNGRGTDKDKAKDKGREDDDKARGKDKDKDKENGREDEDEARDEDKNESI